MDVSLGFVLVIYVGVLLMFLGSGMWIGFALTISGVLCSALFSGGVEEFLSAVMFGQINKFVLTAIPMFIFMGEIVLRTGLSQRMYRGVTQWASIFPGRLLHSNIIACAIFSAISGSSVVTAATIGSVAIPEQEGLGYQRRLVVGSLAAGGTLGILIPPSIIMIVYGAWTGNSVGRLFAGGVIPGTILAIFFMIYIAIAIIRDPSQAPKAERLTLTYFSRFFSSLKDVWPMLLIMLLVLGSIYIGWATPTEAAACGSFISIILAAAYRRLNFQLLKEAGKAAMRTTAMVVFLIVGASILSAALGLAKIPTQLTELIADLGVSRYVVWLLIACLYIVLGMFIEALSMMLLTLPVTYSVMVIALGFDPIWFGIVLVVLIELGQLTPPVGINLYVIHGITKEKRFGDIVWGIVPFCACQLIMLGLLTTVPILALWLPNMLFG